MIDVERKFLEYPFYKIADDVTLMVESRGPKSEEEFARTQETATQQTTSQP